MPSKVGQSGEIHCAREGYCVSWSRQGLEIRATDYHAGVLQLPWAALFELASTALGDSHTVAVTSVKEIGRSFRPEKI